MDFDPEKIIAEMERNQKLAQQRYEDDRKRRRGVIETEFGIVHTLDNYPISLERDTKVTIEDMMHLERYFELTLDMPVIILNCAGELDGKYTYAMYHTDSVLEFRRDNREPELREFILHREPERVIGLWNGTYIAQLAPVIAECYKDLISIFADLARQESYLVALKGTGFDERELKKNRIGPVEIRRLNHIVDEGGSGLLITAGDVFGYPHCGSMLITKCKQDTLDLLFCAANRSCSSRYRIDHSTDWSKELRGNIEHYDIPKLVLARFDRENE